MAITTEERHNIVPSLGGNPHGKVRQPGCVLSQRPKNQVNALAGTRADGLGKRFHRWPHCGDPRAPPGSR